MVSKEITMVKIKTLLLSSNKALSVYDIFKALPEYSYGSLIRVVDLLELMNEIKTRKIVGINSNRTLRMVELNEAIENECISEV